MSLSHGLAVSRGHLPDVCCALVMLVAVSEDVARVALCFHLLLGQVLDDLVRTRVAMLLLHALLPQGRRLFRQVVDLHLREPLKVYQRRRMVFRLLGRSVLVLLDALHVIDILIVLFIVDDVDPLLALNLNLNCTLNASFML